MLQVRPKMWIMVSDPNPDLAEVGDTGYSILLSKSSAEELHRMASARSGRSSGSVLPFCRKYRPMMHMLTYREAVLEAYIKAHKRGVRTFQEHVHLRTDLPLPEMVEWFLSAEVEPQEFLDIVLTGQYSKFHPPQFGQKGIIFPDEPGEENAWWPNDYNIPTPHGWKLHVASSGDHILRSW